MKIDIDRIIKNEYCTNCLYCDVFVKSHPCDICKHGGGEWEDKSYFYFDADTILDEVDIDGYC